MQEELENLLIWRIAAIGCCKARKTLETMLLDTVLIEVFFWGSICFCA